MRVEPALRGVATAHERARVEERAHREEDADCEVAAVEQGGHHRVGVVGDGAPQVVVVGQEDQHDRDAAEPVQHGDPGPDRPRASAHIRLRHRIHGLDSNTPVPPRPGHGDTC